MKNVQIPISVMMPTRCRTSWGTRLQHHMVIMFEYQTPGPIWGTIFFTYFDLILENRLGVIHE